MASDSSIGMSELPKFIISAKVNVVNIGGD